MKTLFKKRVFIPVVAVLLLVTTSAFKNDFFEIAKQIEKFYNSHGFIKSGEGYLEDGIPHIKMVIN